MRRGGALCAMLVGGVLASACSSFGENAPVPADAGSSAAGQDASLDALAVDGGGAGSPCPAGALLCEDFEGDLSRWGAFPQQLSIRGADGHGNVLVATAPAGGPDKTFIATALDGATPKLRVTFDVRVADPGFTTEGSNSNYAIVSLVSPDVYVGFFLAPGSGGTMAQATANATAFVATERALLPYGQWRTVSIDVELSSAGSVSFAIDGVSGAKKPISATFAPPELLLGISRFNLPTPALSVELDHVAVENLP